MKKIPLSNGGFAIVDAADFDFLNQWKWKRHVQGYACRTSWKDKKWTCVLMHRVLVEAGEGQYVDHINRDKLDNRRENLRAIPRGLNNHNAAPQNRSTSGARGVRWDKSRGKWSVGITVDKKTVFLGRFTNLDDAITARQLAEKELLPL